MAIREIHVEVRHRRIDGYQTEPFRSRIIPGDAVVVHDDDGDLLTIEFVNVEELEYPSDKIGSAYNFEVVGKIIVDIKRATTIGESARN